MSTIFQLKNDFKPVEPIIGSKAKRLAALEERRAKPVEKIDNGKLTAGSHMYCYCTSCGYPAAAMHELDMNARKPQLCPECESLRELGWLE